MNSLRFVDPSGRIASPQRYCENYSGILPSVCSARLRIGWFSDSL